MTDHVANPQPAPGSGSPPPSKSSADARQPLFPIAHSWITASVAGAVMVLLALLGVGLTTTSSGAAPAYWISLVPIFGLLCISTAWARAKRDPHSLRPQVVRQIFHWVGIAVALGLDFYIRGTGTETATAAGLNAMLLLALGCYLAGVHLEWLFALVGVVLTVALVTVAKAEQYLWLIFVVGAVAIVAMVAWRWMLEKSHSR